MGWKIPVAEDNGGDFTPREQCPAGEYPAVLVAIIDLGTQLKREYGKTTTAPKHMVYVAWELQGPETSEGEPFYFCEEYTCSLHEKANFRAVLEMGGSVIDGAEFEVEEALGTPYLLTVEEAVSGKGTEYTRLAKDGVSRLPRAMRAGLHEPACTMFAWTLGMRPWQPYGWLPYLYGRNPRLVVEGCQELAAPRAGVPAGPKRPAEIALAADEEEDPF